MLRAFSRAALTAIVLLATPLAFAHEGHDHGAAENSVGALQLSDGFARATLPNAPVGGGYVTITNTGATADRLIAVSTPAAETGQLHEMAMEGEVMKMRDLPEGVEIPAGATVTLAPGGVHMMFMGLTQPFVEGESITVFLTFEHAGSIELELPVLGAGAAGAAPAHH